MVLNWNGGCWLLLPTPFWATGRLVGYKMSDEGWGNLVAAHGGATVWVGDDRQLL